MDEIKWVSLGLFHPEISGVIWAPTYIWLQPGPTGRIDDDFFEFSSWTTVPKSLEKRHQEKYPPEILVANTCSKPWLRIHFGCKYQVSKHFLVAGIISKHLVFSTFFEFALDDIPNL